MLAALLFGIFPTNSPRDLTLSIGVCHYLQAASTTLITMDLFAVTRHRAALVGTGNVSCLTLGSFQIFWSDNYSCGMLGVSQGLLHWHTGHFHLGGGVIDLLIYNHVWGKSIRWSYDHWDTQLCPEQALGVFWRTHGFSTPACTVQQSGMMESGGTGLPAHWIWYSFPCTGSSLFSCKFRIIYLKQPKGRWYL